MFEHCGHGFIVIDAFDSSSCKISPAFTSGHVLLQHRDIQDRDGRSSRRWGWCSWLNLAEFSSVFPFNAPLLHCSHCSIGCHWSLVSFSYPQRYQERRCADCWKSWRRLVSCFDRQDLSMPLHGHVDLTVSAMCHQGANTSEEHVSSTLPSNLFVFKWVWELNGMYKATNPFYLRLWQNSGIFDRFADVSIWKDCLSASNSRAA